MDVPKPKIKNPTEVQIRIRAVAIYGNDDRTLQSGADYAFVPKNIDLQEKIADLTERIMLDKVYETVKATALIFTAFNMVKKKEQSYWLET